MMIGDVSTEDRILEIPQNFWWLTNQTLILLSQDFADVI